MNTIRLVLLAGLTVAMVIAVACEEQTVGVPPGVFATADQVQVRSAEPRACRILAAEGRVAVAEVLDHYSEWPEVDQCDTQRCDSVVAEWKSGNLVLAEVGLCEDRVTIHVPGPQGCGRRPTPEHAARLREALRMAGEQ